MKVEDLLKKLLSNLIIILKNDNILILSLMKEKE